MADYDIAEHLRRIEATAEDIVEDVGEISSRLRGVEHDVARLYDDWLGPREDRWRGAGPDPAAWRDRLRILWGAHKDRRAVRAFLVTVISIVSVSQIVAAVALWMSWMGSRVPS